MEAAILTQAAGQAAGSMVMPAVEGSKSIFHYLKLNYGYVKNMRKNFGSLENEYKYLCAKKEDVKKKLEINKLDMEKTHECETWLQDVEIMKLEIGKLENDYKNTPRFLCGVCPFPSLLKIGKQIEKMTKEVHSLKDRIGQVRSLMVDRPPAPVMKMPTKNIAEFPSLSNIMDKLQECLSDANLKRICLWGPLGIGKTTIMKNLHNSVGEEFKIVFWVTLDRDGDERKIQDILLHRLKIKATDDSVETKASIIFDALKDKSYLLFLDEVFSEIDLEKVGINHEHKGKVIFACRQKNICGLTDEGINVQKLSAMDAQNLFWTTVGRNLQRNQAIKREASQIINECGGIPYMINLMGKKLANESDLAIWKDTLFKLRSPSKEPMKNGDEVYKFLRFEVDELRGKEKDCFLYLAIFPAGCKLYRDYVIECWRAEQYLRDFDNLGSARNRGHTILNDLVKKSLVEMETTTARYRMFEYFHRVARRFTELYKNCCIQDGERNGEIKWEDATRISLSCNLSLSPLPEKPICCGVLTLLLHKSNLEEFPISFFQHMECLQLLDLHKTNIRLLPSSISSLVNLKALFLNNCCRLMHLPGEVGDLHKLEIFDIRGTGMHCLPSEIGKLTELKCLKVSFMKNEHIENHNNVEAGSKEMISSNIIARLHSLEELSIDVTPTDRRWNQNVENIVAEVSALKELTTLRFYFPTMKCFQTLISSSKSWNEVSEWRGDSIRSFKIVVGYQQSNPLPEFDVFECSTEKCLRFSGGEGFPDAILKMLKQARAFELIGHHDAANLSSFEGDNLEGLETCIIEDCREMTSIIEGNLHTRGVAFQYLDKLYISSLPKLVHIWNGSMGSKSLTMLTTLTLKRCNSVKTLLSQAMIVQLNQLQYLQVENCQMIEEIIEAASIIESRAFPKLKNLELINLPRLSNICDNESLTWRSLETIKIDACQELRNFPFTFKAAARLIVIHCTQDLWNQLLWPNDSVREHFQGLHRPI